MAPPTHGVLETCLYVDNIGRAARFYERVLGAEVFLQEDGRHAFTRIGQSLVFLFHPETTRIQNPPGKGTPVPTHGADGEGHVAFAIEPEQLEAWRAHLAACDVPIEEEIEWPNGARSLYFRDPDDNSLEIATRSLWAHVLDRAP
jgi:catechol 2,3-dioxygenase-like lactoylglutathione lyase family enzyme